MNLMIYFGKYFSRDNVIKQIRENLNFSIIWNDEINREDILGQYNTKDKKIKIKNGLDEEKIKTVFFHEMIHCITTYNGLTGFINEYVLEDIDDIKIYTCKGITEGFTEYLTMIRDKKYSKNPIKSYPILTKQTENLIELLGKEEFLSKAFTNPRVLEEFLSYEDVDSLLSAFDIIWKNEKELYLSTNANENKPKEKLLIAIFGGTPGYIKNKRKIDEAAKEIIEILSSIILKKDINSVEDFIQVFNSIEKYSTQLNLESNYQNYIELFEKINDIMQKMGINRKGFLDILPENSSIKNAVNSKFIMDDFESLSTKEKLLQLSEINIKDTGLSTAIYDSPFSEAFKDRIVNNIFGPHIEYPEREYFRLTDGLAKIILDRSYDIRTLSTENISFENEDNNIDIFNLYMTLKDRKIYLGTFFHDTLDLGEMSGFLPVKNKAREKSIRKDQGINENAKILVDSKGNLFIIEEDGKYTHIDKEGKKHKTQKISNQKSYVEAMNENVLSRKNRIKKLIELRSS